GADVDRLLAARPKGFGADDACDGRVDAARCEGGAADTRTGDGDHHDDVHQGHRDDAGGYPDLPWLQFVERRGLTLVMSLKWHGGTLRAWRGAAYRPGGEVGPPIFRHLYVVARLPWRKGLRQVQKPNERKHQFNGMVERRRQFMAAHRRHVRRPDEHPGPRFPLRRRNAETLVCELDDDGVRRLRGRAHPLGPGRLQNGLRGPDPHL